MTNTELNQLRCDIAKLRQDNTSIRLINESLLNENSRLRSAHFTPAELATIRADLAECERAVTTLELAESIVRSLVSKSWNEEIEFIAQLLRELDAAKKVADAAVVAQTAWENWCRIRTTLPVHLKARAELEGVFEDARNVMAGAVREYRALTEGGKP